MRKVLVVDDEKSIVLIMSRILVKKGFTVHTAEDLAKAESLIDEHAYDLVITDISLGGSFNADGMEIIERAREANPEAMIVAMSGSRLSDARRQTLERGADYFFDKPFDVDELIDLFREWESYTVTECRNLRTSCNN